MFVTLVFSHVKGHKSFIHAVPQLGIASKDLVSVGAPTDFDNAAFAPTNF